MKLEKDMYVRTTNGISKITCNDCTSEEDEKQGYNCHRHIIVAENSSIWDCFIDKDEVIKSSFNPIDLIEVGDIIEYYNEDRKVSLKILTEQHLINIKKNIKTFSRILTHEQYEANVYKIGEDK